MSCVKRPDRAPTILYAAEDFYSADLEQVWLRDGECISYMNTSLKCPYEENQNTSDINWNYRNNTDGSYSLTSYLHLSSQTPQNMIYICWVNHSTLSQPITANISSTECTEREQASIGICLLGFLDYTVGASPLPELVSQCASQTQVYSTLGNRRPVPCKINSSLTTSDSV
ncbi:uncharacterized protein LOC113543640 [Tachysurus ichikawai]